MITRLYRHRRAQEAAFRLQQSLWELGNEHPSLAQIQSIIPNVVEPLRPDRGLEQATRTLLENGRIKEATELLERNSSIRFFVTVLIGFGALGTLLTVIWALSMIESGHTRTVITNPGQECAKELEEGLLAIRESRDYHYEVVPEDVDDLMRNGFVVLGYFRDGVRVEVSYTVRQEAGQCTLAAWQVRRDLGQRWEGARGEFGTVDLRECSCQ